MGARVIAAASSAEKLEICRQHGADDVIDYAREDLKERVKALTGGAGADVVYDPVGGPFTEPALRATAWEGRFLVIGFAAGDIPRIPTNLTLLKGCSIVGRLLGNGDDARPGARSRAARRAPGVDGRREPEAAPAREVSRSSARSTRSRTSRRVACTARPWSSSGPTREASPAARAAAAPDGNGACAAAARARARRAAPRRASAHRARAGRAATAPGGRRRRRVGTAPAAPAPRPTSSSPAPFARTTPRSSRGGSGSRTCGARS